jgi:hypothetical protein
MKDLSLSILIVFLLMGSFYMLGKFWPRDKKDAPTILKCVGDECVYIHSSTDEYFYWKVQNGKIKDVK